MESPQDEIPEGLANVKLPTYNYVTHPSVKGTYPLCPPGCQEVFDSAVKYIPDDDDTFVVTYNKSGTTWMNNILYLMRNDGNPLPKEDNIANHIAFIDFLGAEKTKKFARPRFIKSHLRYSMLPQNPKAKYICVARNLKDCATSLYYHTIGYNIFYHWPDGKFDDFFELFMHGRCDWGDCFEMVAEWHQRSLEQENILFLLFEDMKVDLKKEVLKVGEFLGPSWKEKLEKNDGELLKKVVELSSFEAMKKEEKKFSYERPKGKPFLRKGVVGDWKHLLSREQSDRMDRRFAETGRLYPGFEKIWSQYEDLLKY